MTTTRMGKSQKLSDTNRKRAISIVGAGQAGLQLACGLLQKDYDVTLYTNRTAEQIYGGRILSSQTIFHEALATERKIGLNFWDQQCPKNIAISLAVGSADSQNKSIEWKGLMDHFYQSVDQRVKIPAWMDYFEKLGGKLIVQDITFDELNKITDASELTIVASGKGEISNIFRRNDKYSSFNTPQRVVTCLYVMNVKPEFILPGSRVSIIPNIGEYFSTPGFTHGGPCEIIQFEGIINGPFDCWDGIQSGEAYLDRALFLLSKYVPWEYERCMNMELTDNLATLTGRFTPIVRHPVASMPCGKNVLGLADALILNDPIAAQGANNAAKAADLYLESILQRQDQPFDRDWMQQTFDCFWKKYGQWAVRWTNMLLEPPTLPVQKLLAAAQHLPSLASKIANGFDKPASLFSEIIDITNVKEVVESFAEEVELG